MKEGGKKHEKWAAIPPEYFHALPPPQSLKRIGEGGGGGGKVATSVTFSRIFPSGKAGESLGTRASPL